MAILQTTASPPAFRIDARILTDGSSVDRTMPSFDRINEPNFSLDRVLSGNFVQTHRLRTYNSLRGPSAVWQHKWSTEVRYCDDTLFPLVCEICMRPIRHSFHDKLTDYEFFDGDASTTDFYLKRPLLSTAYTQVAATGRWTNIGGTCVYVLVKDLEAGTTFTPIYGNPPAAPAAGEVAIWNGGTYAFRHIKVGTAPGNVQGVLRVKGWFLYTVAPHVTLFKLPGDRDCTINVAYQLELTEL